MYSLRQLFLVFLLGKLSVFLRDGAFCHCNDGESAALSVPVLDLVDHLLDVIGNLGNQDNVGAAGHTGIQGQPSYLVAHNFHNEDSAVGSRRGVDVVNGIRGNVYSALEAEGHVCSPQVIVNGLGQGDDIQPFLAQQVGGLMSAVAAQNDQAVQLQLVIILLHCLYLVQPVLVRLLNGLEGRTGCSQHGAALCQDAGEVFSGEHLELAVDQAPVAIQEAVDLHLLSAVVQGLYNASHRRIQGLAIPAAGQHTNSPHVSFPPRLLFVRIFSYMPAPFYKILPFSGQICNLYRKKRWKVLQNCSGCYKIERRSGKAVSVFLFFHRDLGG